MDQEIKQYPTSREIKDYHGKHALEKNVIYYGRMGLCGMFALSYAITTGYKDIYLLGYDFGSPNLNQKFTHWYQDRIVDLGIQSTGAGRPEVYLHKQEGHENKIKEEIEDFHVYNREHDVIINNVSLISNIKYFPQMDYEEFFRRIEWKKLIS